MEQISQLLLASHLCQFSFETSSRPRAWNCNWLRLSTREIHAGHILSKIFEFGRRWIFDVRANPINIGHLLVFRRLVKVGVRRVCAFVLAELKQGSSPFLHRVDAGWQWQFNTRSAAGSWALHQVRGSSLKVFSRSVDWSVQSCILQRFVRCVLSVPWTRSLSWSRSCGVCFCPRKASAAYQPLHCCDCLKRRSWLPSESMTPNAAKT